MFKSKFSGWDDVLAVDFTKTAKSVAQFRKVFYLLDGEKTKEYLGWRHSQKRIWLPIKW